MFQIDYAGKAIEQSGTLIGLRGKTGVVLAVEKIVRSPLYEEDAGARIYSVDKHIGIVSEHCIYRFVCRATMLKLFNLIITHILLFVSGISWTFSRWSYYW